MWNWGNILNHANLKAGSGILSIISAKLGATNIQAVRFGRKFIGIDVSEEYLEISRKRLEKVAVDAKKY